MNLNYYKAESSIEPEVVDETLSKVFVYIRKNIQKVDRDENTFYEYEEAKLTHEEYKQYLIELSAKNTLEDIKSLQNENKNLTEQLNTLMECLLEMSENVYA